jgi:uncharacterized membrane protein
MSDTAPPLPDPAETTAERPAPDDVGPATAVSLLIDEARAAVDEELALAKAFAAAAGVTARTVVIFGVLAVLLLLVALMALAVGLMLSLVPVTGMLGATAIVVGLLLIASAIAGWLVRRAIRRFQAAVAARD